jgi:hypothetical protein
MNKKLIFRLSLIGLAMAIATVFWIPSNLEPFFWLIIFIFCAYIIAKKCSAKYFLNGFLLSLANCIWVTSAHIIFIETYLVHHTHEAVMITKMPLPDSPRLMMLIMGPVIGIISGFVLGLFAFVASKVVKYE